VARRCPGEVGSQRQPGRLANKAVQRLRVRNGRLCRLCGDVNIVQLRLLAAGVALPRARRRVRLRIWLLLKPGLILWSKYAPPTPNARATNIACPAANSQVRVGSTERNVRV